MLQFVKIEKVPDWEKELKRKVKKERRKEFWEAWRKWAMENPQIVVPMALGTTVALAKGVKGASKIVQAMLESVDKNRRIYDHRLGKYHYLKRAMRQSELLEMTERLSNGEKLVDILMSMNLLKG